jgi:hypothetical protein
MEHKEGTRDTKAKKKRGIRIPEPHPLLLWGGLIAELISLYHYSTPAAAAVGAWITTPIGIVALLVANLVAIVAFGRK